MSEVTPKNANKWGGNQKRTVVREVKAMDVSKNANHVKVGFRFLQDLA